MSSFSDKIRDLNEKIEKKNILLERYEKQLLELSNELATKTSNNSQEKINDLEGKLKNLQIQLQSCQTEKDDCSLTLGTKIEEIKNSNLSVEEKSKQIIELALGNKTELDKSCRSLTNAWINCGKLQEKLHQILEQRVKDQEKIIEQQEKSKKRMAHSIYGLLAAVILLSLSLSLSLYGIISYKKTKNKWQKLKTH